MHAVSSACEGGGGAEEAAILCWRHVGPAGFIMLPPELLVGAVPSQLVLSMLYTVFYDGSL